METLWNYVFCPDMAQLGAWLVVFVVDVLWHLHSRIRDDGPVHRPVHGPVLFGSFGKGEGFTCITQVSNKDLTDSDKKNPLRRDKLEMHPFAKKNIESKYPHIRNCSHSSPSQCFLTWKNISSQYLLTGYHVPPRKLIAPKGGGQNPIPAPKKVAQDVQKKTNIMKKVEARPRKYVYIYI